MQKALFSNDLSGFETSFPQLGHLAMPTVSITVLYRTVKACPSLEDVLAHLDTTTHQNQNTNRRLKSFHDRLQKNPSIKKLPEPFSQSSYDS